MVTFVIFNKLDFHTCEKQNFNRIIGSFIYVKYQLLLILI